MDFTLSKQQQMVQKMYREFAENEVKPLAKKVDAEEYFPKETVEKMGKLGMMGIYFPTSVGGAGGDVLSYVMAVEELSKVCGTTGVIVSAHTSLCAAPIYENGTPEQKAKYLPKLCSGEWLGAFGLTEPGAGTDAQGQQTIAGSKSVAELAEIVKLAARPFIVKGVMTIKGALKAKEAGAAAIVVSNHGGRVLDQCPATAEVLPEIAEALKGSGVKILVDGGIRTGVDVFKALALGADAVLICRPFVTAVYGGGEEGVKCYIDKIAAELADTMQMCGAHSLAEITRDMVRI